jgi:hypothetical protein
MPEPALVLDFEVLEVALRQEPIVARIYSSHVMLVCTLAVSLSAKLITSIHFGKFQYFSLLHMQSRALKQYFWTYKLSKIDY